MSKIIAIGTAVPEFRHRQNDILEFMLRVYAPNEPGRRKMKFLYRQGGIETRYSVIPDYSLPAPEWKFFPPAENLEPFPGIEQRLDWFRTHAATLSGEAIENCLGNYDRNLITHLITVSCTGFSAPGLDWEIAENLKLSPHTSRTSINFMGCYAAIHALKLADAFCKADQHARVLIVATELCTLHFQKEAKPDHITSSMLFGDGSAAVLVTGDKGDGCRLEHFYSTVAPKGKKDMAWEISSHGFVMTLSSYIPELIEENFKSLVEEALGAAGLELDSVTDWCIHPGGKKILEAVHKSLEFTNGHLQFSYEVLKNFGNMSSPTVLFVLEKLLKQPKEEKRKIFGAAFGPGLTMETFILSA